VEALDQHLFNLAAHQPDIVYESDPFYQRAAHLAWYGALVAALIAAGGLAVAVANSVVERRRSLASLTASGVPRGVLRRAVIWQTAAVAVPAITVAMATGVALSASIAHPTVTRGGSGYSCTAPAGDPDACMSADPRARGAIVVEAPKATLRVPVPWRDLVVIGGWGPRCSPPAWAWCSSARVRRPKSCAPPDVPARPPGPGRQPSRRPASTVNSIHGEQQPP
jgi:hypothetical protein